MVQLHVSCDQILWYFVLVLFVMTYMSDLHPLDLLCIRSDISLGGAYYVCGEDIYSGYHGNHYKDCFPLYVG